MLAFTCPVQTAEGQLGMWYLRTLPAPPTWRALLWVGSCVPPPAQGARLRGNASWCVLEERCPRGGASTACVEVRGVGTGACAAQVLQGWGAGWAGQAPCCRPGEPAGEMPLAPLHTWQEPKKFKSC